MSPLALAELAELKRSDGNAYEPGDFQSQLGEDAAELAVLSFVENDLEPRARS